MEKYKILKNGEKIILPKYDEKLNIKDTLKLVLYYREHILEFIEDTIYINQVGGTVKFKLYQKQKEFVNIFLEHHYMLVHKSRQIGLSTITQAIITALMVLYSNMNIGVISKDLEEAVKFSKKVKNMIENLPMWIRPVSMEKKVEKNFILNNKSELQATTINAHKPEAALRGSSVNLLVIDEAAFIDKIQIAYTGLMPAISKVHKVSKELGLPYGTIIISTPNKTVGIGEWYYRQYVSAKKGTSGYKVFTVHWSEIEGLDIEWYKQQCSLCENDPLVIAQELDLKFVASSNAVFEEKIQTYLQNENNFPDPLEIKNVYVEYKKEGNDIAEIKANCKVVIYERYNPEKEYLMGIDIATERGFCATSIKVVDSMDLKIVAEYVGNINSLLIPEIIKKIADMYPEVLIIPERNSYGEMVCDLLAADKKYRPRLFYTVKELKSGKKEKIPGLLTNRMTRPLIMEALVDYVRNNYMHIRSKTLALELIDLIDKNGKIMHGSGSRDDEVMSFAFCCYVRMFGLVKHTKRLRKDEKESINQLFFDGQNVFGDNIDTNMKNEDLDDWSKMFI